jgi:hypothetical protein
MLIMESKSTLHLVHLSVLLYGKLAFLLASLTATKAYMIIYHDPHAAICYMAQAPLLPYLTKQFGASDTSYGWLQSSFSALQFLGGLLSGG